MDKKLSAARCYDQHWSWKAKGYEQGYPSQRTRARKGAAWKEQESEHTARIPSSIRWGHRGRRDQYWTSFFSCLPLNPNESPVKDSGWSSAEKSACWSPEKVKKGWSMDLGTKRKTYSRHMYLQCHLICSLRVIRCQIFSFGFLS